MAYFPNGMSFIDWQATQCDGCLNFRDNGSGSLGCPITDAHFTFDYHEGTHAAILDSFIPDDHGEPPKCAMRLTLEIVEEEKHAAQTRIDFARYTSALAESRLARLTAKDLAA